MNTILSAKKDPKTTQKLLMLKLRLLFSLLLLGLSIGLMGQGTLINTTATPTQTWQPDVPPPKREFRAVWIATVFNTDYPKNPTPRRVGIKEQFKVLLEDFKRLGFNAVVVQIRPAADAFYLSKHAPWSAFLTGKQGQAPIPSDFDPLTFMVEENPPAWDGISRLAESLSGCYEPGLCKSTSGSRFQ